MWNATANVISPLDIQKEHLRVLEEAITNVGDSDPNTKDVRKSIDYFYARCSRRGGIDMVLVGMQMGRQDVMMEGLKRLKRNLGVRI